MFRLAGAGSKWPADEMLHIIVSYLKDSLYNRKTFISPPTYRRGTIVLRPVRSFVRIFLRGHSLKLSEILHEVVTLDRLKSAILRFFKKKSRYGPRGSKGVRKVPKWAKWPKMTLFEQ